MPLLQAEHAVLKSMQNHTWVISTSRLQSKTAFPSREQEQRGANKWGVSKEQMKKGLQVSERSISKHTCHPEDSRRNLYLISSGKGYERP